MELQGLWIYRFIGWSGWPAPINRQTDKPAESGNGPRVYRFIGCGLGGLRR